MPKRYSPHPTEAELEVLRILWKRGASTVREVHAVVEGAPGTSLTSTLKTLQVMTGKGLVVRLEERPLRYAAALPEATTQTGMLKDLMEKAFDGSAQKLLLRLVNTEGVSREELEELGRLVREAAEKRGLTTENTEGTEDAPRRRK